MDEWVAALTKLIRDDPEPEAAGEPGSAAGTDRHRAATYESIQSEVMASSPARPAHAKAKIVATAPHTYEDADLAPPPPPRSEKTFLMTDGDTGRSSGDSTDFRSEEVVYTSGTGADDAGGAGTEHPVCVPYALALLADRPPHHAGDPTSR